MTVRDGEYRHHDGIDYQVIHFKTKASQVEMDDGSTVENKVSSHLAENASQDNVHGLRGENVSLGMWSNASGLYSIALGRGANAATDRSIVIGYNAESSASMGTIMGYNARGTGNRGTVVGYGASAGSYSTALGFESSCAGGSSVALGREASTDGLHSIAIGYGSTASNSYEGILGTAAQGGREWIVPGNFTVSGTKNFEIPHPKPEKQATHRIRHGAVESPTAGDTLYRYAIKATKDNDIVTIDLPDYFVYLNKDVQIFVTGQGHFGNGYGELNEETEQLEIHCQFEGGYNVLVIGTRNDDHQSVKDWSIKGVEREIGESWTGETYVFSVDEIMEIEEIKEVSA